MNQVLKSVTSILIILHDESGKTVDQLLDEKKVQ